MTEPIDLAASRMAAQRGGLLSSGGYLKFQEGDNRFRVLTAPLPHPGNYNGRPTFKWLLYVLDRADGQVKPLFMPNSIFQMLEELQKDPDFEFSSVPLPYDVNVKTVGAGKKEVRYTLIPSPKRVPLTESEEALLAAATPLAQLQEQIKAKAEGGPEKKFDPDEVPF